MDNGRNLCSNNIEYYESLNSTNLFNFSNNITSNNGFSQWIEENTCVFCVIVVLLSFALIIFISLIMVRLFHGTKKTKKKRSHNEARVLKAAQSAYSGSYVTMLTC